MKKVYNYDNQGIFLGFSFAQVCPKTKTDLLPRNATFKEPKGSLKNGYKWIWKGDKWEQVRYYNNEKMYNPNNDYFEVNFTGINSCGLVEEIPQEVLDQREQQRIEAENAVKVEAETTKSLEDRIAQLESIIEGLTK